MAHQPVEMILIKQWASLMAEDQIPLLFALTKQVSTHRRLRFLRADKRWSEIAVTAIPIVGEGNRHLGAMVTMWEEAKHTRTGGACAARRPSDG